jgi:hypothetical protein
VRFLLGCSWSKQSFSLICGFLLIEVEYHLIG